MGKRQKVIQETTTTIILDNETTESSPESSETYVDLSEKLAKIRKMDGIMGYILRGKYSATIDLDDPEKIVEYALLSSKTLASVQALAEGVDTGDVETALLEGQDIKAIFMQKGDNRIDLFMQKNVDHAPILDDISI